MNNLHSKAGSGRKSNLEILRIVSMCLVLMLHYIPTRMIPNHETINSSLLESLINLELRSLAFVGVNCFILISGYFGINWKLKSFISLIYRIIFWSFCSYLMALFLSPYFLNCPLEYKGNIINNIFTLRWFVGAYICLYVFSPILNKFLNSTTQKELGLFILAFYALIFIFGWVLKSNEFNEGMNMLSLSGIYLIGGYLKRYTVRFTNLEVWTDLLVYLGIGFSLVILSVIALRFNISKSLYGYLNPLIIVQSVYLFLFFKKIKIKNTIIINTIAASSFSVYLLHDDVCLRPIYNSICEIINSYGSFLSLILIFIFFSLLFIICMMIDKVGNEIFKFISNFFTKPKYSNTLIED